MPGCVFQNFETVHLTKFKLPTATTWESSGTHLEDTREVVCLEVEPLDVDDIREVVRFQPPEVHSSLVSTQLSVTA